MLITFDLDGVLIENPFAKGVFPEVKNILFNQYCTIQGNSVKENISEKEIKKEIWQNILRQFRLLNKSSQAYQSYNWDLVIQKTADQMGLKGEIDVETLVKKYCLPSYIHCYDSNRDVLQWLNDSGYNLKVITNGYYKYQIPVLKFFQLEVFFKEIITSDRVKAVKPHPQIFKAVKGRSYNNWFHIGDSVLMDVYGANRVGANTILILRDLPQEITTITPGERLEYPQGKNIIECLIEKESELHNFNLNNKFIYPDFLLCSLQELEEII